MCLLLDAAWILPLDAGVQEGWKDVNLCLQSTAPELVESRLRPHVLAEDHTVRHFLHLRFRFRCGLSLNYRHHPETELASAVGNLFPNSYH